MTVRPRKADRETGFPFWSVSRIGGAGRAPAGHVVAGPPMTSADVDAGVVERVRKRPSPDPSPTRAAVPQIAQRSREIPARAGGVEARVATPRGYTHRIFQDPSHPSLSRPVDDGGMTMTIAVIANAVLMAGVVAALVHFTRIPFRISLERPVEESAEHVPERDLSRAA